MITILIAALAIAWICVVWSCESGWYRSNPIDEKDIFSSEL